jgi:ubiquinone biosynthesis protein
VARTLFRSMTTLLIRTATARVQGRQDTLIEVGECMASTFELLGGAYLKIGQILSTRTDILCERLVAPLQRLQDSLPQLPAETIRGVVERSLGIPVATLFRSFDPVPIGSASIAQVHRAVLRDCGTEVAVKVRRPGTDRLITVDSHLFLALTRAISSLPPFRGIPVNEAAYDVMEAIRAQVSFRTEAERHRLFFGLFEGGVPICVPRLMDRYCTDEVLVMEYLPNLIRITAAGLNDKIHRDAVIAGLNGLYKMLFVAGLVHGDLHPGNILVGADGRVVVLDFGFSTVMSPLERRGFAEFFLSIALGDGETAARILLQTALRVPVDLRQIEFEGDIDQLVRQSSGLTAGNFLIASFVNSLFTIQKKHRIYGSPRFTMAILSLAVYEGIIRNRCADLDFQREAMPTLLLALQPSH